uniref:Uncharacterized protein n=1 Tax=Cucumis melo TaxID=3656 RepID=A0A9I9E4J5_CUCME
MVMILEQCIGRIRVLMQKRSQNASTGVKVQSKLGHIGKKRKVVTRPYLQKNAHRRVTPKLDFYASDCHHCGLVLGTRDTCVCESKEMSQELPNCLCLLLHRQESIICVKVWTSTGMNRFDDCRAVVGFELGRRLRCGIMESVTLKLVI